MLAFLDRLFGLPAHPLLVHLPVLLVPVSAIALLAIAVRPAWCAKFGPAVVALAVITLASVQLAMTSGESLQEHVGEHALVERHAQLADPLRPLALAVLVLAGVLVYLHRRHRDAIAPTRSRWLSGVLLVLTVLVGVGSVVQIARVGHSGAKAVWHDKGNRTVPDRD